VAGEGQLSGAERSLPGQVAGSLRALSTEIDRLDQAAADRYGLNRTDMRALDILGRAGPLAPTALARLLGFTTGGVTTVLDRLEKAGYIRRRPDPGDRRRQVVETTAATAARDEEVFGALIRATTGLLAGYTDDQLLVINDFLDRARQVTAAHADALGSHAQPGPGTAETTRRSRG
jgi:DNA-binding MarR family transcriptional regulator